MRNASLVGVFVGAYGSEARAELHEQLLAYFEAGRIAPRINAERRFEELPTALSELAARRVIGRLVLKVGVRER
jgi:NADPH:quinone reductase-like Zn-dependent oxidoreductase